MIRDEVRLCPLAWLTQSASLPMPSLSPNCQPFPTWAGASSSGSTRTPLTRAYSTMSLMISGVYTFLNRVGGLQTFLNKKRM